MYSQTASGVPGCWTGGHAQLTQVICALANLVSVNFTSKHDKEVSIMTSLIRYRSFFLALR